MNKGQNAGREEGTRCHIKVKRGIRATDGLGRVWKAECCNLSAYPHGCEDNGKVVCTIVHHILGLLHQASLTTDLGSNLKAPIRNRVRHTDGWTEGLTVDKRLSKTT